MKNVNRIFSVSFILLAMLVFGQAVIKAQSSDVQTYQSQLRDGNQLEIIYSQKSKKLGVIVKDQAGNPIGGYIVQNVETPEGTFYLNTAKKFGKTDDSLLVKIKLSKFRDNSVTVSINNESAGEFLSGDSIMPEQPAESQFGVCDGVCNPANPGSYNWNWCFACCFYNRGTCT